jgi:N utilization substance protein A
MVDPLGACVGPSGNRVNTIVNELNGEKIDIVIWNEEPARFIAAALSPAEVERVEVDTEGFTATVVVPDHQLSLAIGKEGQNARLAVRLTGYKIDIKSVTQAEQEAEEEEFEYEFEFVEEDDELVIEEVEE